MDIFKNLEACHNCAFADKRKLGIFTCRKSKKAIQDHAESDNCPEDLYYNPRPVDEIYRELLTREANSLDNSYKGNGKGIVIPGGGKYFVSFYITMRMIRDFGCNLPIELWLLPNEHLFHYQKKLIEGYNIVVKKPLANDEVDGGWQLKSYAIVNSDFEEVLYLDADCYPVKEIDSIFNWPQYQETGCVIWKDLYFPDREPNNGAAGTKIKESIFKELGIPFKDEIGNESGIMLLDKRKCAKALKLYDWMNRLNHHFYYNYVYGDKDILWLALLFLNQKYSTTNKIWKSVMGGGLHADFNGNWLVYHCFNSKIILGFEEFPCTNQCKVPLESIPLGSKVVSFLVDFRNIKDMIEQKYKIHAVSICINHNDYLEMTIENNKRLLDSWTIITTKFNQDTIQLCQKHGLEVILTKRMRLNGSKFNMGAMRNEGINKVKSKGNWTLLLDDDILLPFDFRDRLSVLELDESSIYGANRKEDGDHPISGFFQLFHSSTNNRYRENHIDGSWTDVWFKDLWPNGHKVVLDLYVKHLGPCGVDHAGRVSGPIVNIKKLTDSDLWRLLHERPLFVTDLNMEPRWLDWFIKQIKCGDCQRNFLKLMEQFPPRLESRAAYASWTWEIHNEVNTDVRNPWYVFDDAVKAYGWDKLEGIDDFIIANR